MKRKYPVLASAAAALLALQALAVPSALDSSPVTALPAANAQVNIVSEDTAPVSVLPAVVCDVPQEKIEYIEFGEPEEAEPSAESEKIIEALEEAFVPDVVYTPETTLTFEEQKALDTEAESVFLSEEEAEKAFLAKNPELVALGEIINEGDTLPRSQNDPSYHKYIRSLMALEAGASAPLTSMGVRLVTSAAVSGASSLTHQDRFAGYDKKYGVDVSTYQGTVDWAKVKAAGISFAIMRAGYRGYGSAGTLVVDDKFVTNLKNAKAAGLKVGAYFFTQATNATEAKAEANFVHSYAKSYTLDLPVYCDMEEINSQGRLEKLNLTAAQNTAIISAFCDRVKELGYEPGVYSNPSWLYHKLNRATLESKYQIWLAHWVTNTDYPYSFNTWQYGTGTVNGISGAVDMDVKYVEQHIPAKVTGLTCSTATDTTATLTWTKLAVNCTGYQVIRYDASSKKETVVGTTNLNSYTVTGLTGRTSYSYMVKAYNAVGSTTYYGEASDKATAKTRCPAPAGLGIVEEVGGFTVSWKASSGAAGYKVYIGKYGETPKLVSQTAALSLRYDAAEGAYSGYVVPYETSGKTQLEGGKTSFTFVCGKRTPIVSSITHTDTTVTLALEEQAAAKGFRVRMYTDPSKSAAATVEAAGNTAVFTGLDPLTDYYFKVEAYYADNTSLYTDPIIVRTSSSVAGDIDGDGVFGEADREPLRSFITGISGGEAIDPFTADINKDGSVDLLDYAILKMMLSEQ